MNIKHSVKIEVRYVETDQMGIVYHANYLVWFEIGRTALMKFYGFSYKELEKENVFLPVISLAINYKKPTYYEELLHIDTYISFPKMSQLEFSYQCFNENKDLCCYATSKHIFINQQKKPIKTPASIRTWKKNLLLKKN